MNTMSDATLQHPQDLTLAVLAEDTLPPLNYLRQRTMRFHNWAFHFAIIGESHHIRVMRRGALILDEVLACVDLTPDTCLYHRQFTEIESLAFDMPRYHVRISFDSKALWQQPEPHAKGIEYVFPAVYAQHPVTRIQWWWRGMTLQWRTLHTYAAQHQTTFVHTQSRFDCNDKGS